MANINVTSISPTSGTAGDNNVVSVSVSQYTGRVAPANKVLTISATNEGGTATAQVSLTQSAKAEFVRLNTSSIGIDAEGKSSDQSTVTVTGVSNSKKLSISTSDGTFVTIPTALTANGASASFGTAISGDPGASAEYNFSFTLTFGVANPSVSSRTATVTVTDNGGHTQQITVTQGGQSEYIKVNGQDSVTLDVTNGSNSFTVSSNVPWSVSM